MMSLNQLERTIEGWLRPIPHLPVTWRKWIGENIWWITLIGVILLILGIFTMIAAIFAAMSIFGNATTIYSMYGVSTTPVYTGWWMLASVVALAFMVVSAAILVMAINPLKVQQRKGWDSLFMAFLISVLSSVVSVILNFSIGSLIGGLIGAAIGAAISAYFLFEIRSQFTGIVATSKK